MISLTKDSLLSNATQCIFMNCGVLSELFVHPVRYIIINSHEYKQLPKHLRLLYDKLCNKHTHFFIEILESFEHEPTKKLKRFIFTLLEENVTYEQLKQHLKLE